MPADRPGGEKTSRSTSPSSDATSTGRTPRQNHLLDALPPTDYDRIASNLELLPMAFPLDEVTNFRLFQPYVFPPLNVSEFRASGLNKHVYHFSQKPAA